MAGRTKDVWTARVRLMCRTLIPGKGIHIRMRLILDRDETRELRIDMDIAEAKKWRDALSYFIEKTEKGE